MYRFYCPILADAETGLAARTATVQLDDAEAHHARKVLRLKLGEAVELFDGRGSVGGGELQSWEGGATVRVKSLGKVPPLRPMLDIAAAIPKGPRADDMVSQLSQLGADRLIPLLAERSAVDPRPAKIERFSRATIESAKQCGRAYLMSVTSPTPFAKVLAGGYDLRLMAQPGGGIGGEKLIERLRAAERVLVLIGPEGGWTDDEMRRGAAAGCEPWTLGPLVMRIETAASAAVAVLRYLM